MFLTRHCTNSPEFGQEKTFPSFKLWTSFLQHRCKTNKMPFWYKSSKTVLNQMRRHLFTFVNSKQRHISHQRRPSRSTDLLIKHSPDRTMPSHSWPVVFVPPQSLIPHRADAVATRQTQTLTYDVWTGNTYIKPSLQTHVTERPPLAPPHCSNIPWNLKESRFWLAQFAGKVVFPQWWTPLHQSQLPSVRCRPLLMERHRSVRQRLGS